MIIKIVRHGESEANIGKVDGAIIGNCNIALTDEGKNQARQVGAILGDFCQNALLYSSPYKRTRQTMQELLLGTGLSVDFPGKKIYEDPRLREVDWGYQTYHEYDDCLNELKDVHGPFYIRRTDGESCADCYDRISTFLDTLWRQVERRSLDFTRANPDKLRPSSRVLIVSHGLTIRTFVMRFMHLTVEQFGLLRNPKNCNVITITDETVPNTGGQWALPGLCQYKCGKWGVSGLRLRGGLTDLFGTEKQNESY